ncbi:hypothetical protein ACFLZT_02160 [Thermodesulfobacteriota bacterium]
MTKHSITLRRKDVNGFLSDQSIGTDALNAMKSIPGVNNPQIINESDEQVELMYNWIGDGKFWETGEYLMKFGLARADIE